MTKKVDTKKVASKKATSKKSAAQPEIEQSKVEETKTAPVDTGITVKNDGSIEVSEELKEAARLATEPKEHKKYNKNQSLRVFEYKVYYGDASHENGQHGREEKSFKNLQTAINWIAKETKFFVEEGIERECYSIVLDGQLIAEY